MKKDKNTCNINIKIDKTDPESVKNAMESALKAYNILYEKAYYTEDPFSIKKTTDDYILEYEQKQVKNNVFKRLFNYLRNKW